MDNNTRKTHTVVDMSAYKPETGYAAIAQVEAYWNALRDGTSLPKRSEIDPRGIEHALENAFIIERIAPGVARLRIAGNHLNDIMGMEVRGMPLTAFFTPASRRSIADLLEDVFQMPACSTVRMTSEKGSGRPLLEARMVLLPLKSDLGDVSRILGCFVAKGGIGLAPRRFEVSAINTAPIGIPSDDLADMNAPGVPAPYRPATVPAGLAEPGAPFMRQRTPENIASKGKERPPYLRLIKTDE